MKDHGGTCAYCGGDVRQGFSTCPSCGAIWFKDLSLFSTLGCGCGMMLLLLAAIVGFFGMASETKGNAGAGLALFACFIALISWVAPRKWYWKRGRGR